jgi:hypothetical protein
MYIIIAFVCYFLLIILLNMRLNNGNNLEYINNSKLLIEITPAIKLVTNTCGWKVARQIYGDRVDYLTQYFEKCEKIDIIKSLILLALIPIILLHMTYLLDLYR